MNPIRNMFVVSAYGNQWLQIMLETVTRCTDEPADYTSFFWANNILAETGAPIALMIISYLVLSMLPELQYYLQDVFLLVNHSRKRDRSDR